MYERQEYSTELGVGGHFGVVLDWLTWHALRGDLLRCCETRLCC